MRPDIIPLVIGVSLCSASAVLLYIWYKTKDNEDVTDSASKAKPKVSKFECTIPNTIVPVVVGRSGANLKSIEGKTNTQIRFKAKDDNNQICEITGTLEDVKKAAELIKLEAQPQQNLTEEMFVPQSACGKIIGRCGEALQEICRKSQAKVHIDAGDRNDSDTRRVFITGTKAHVNLAKSLIEEKVRMDEESRKTTEVKREPRGNGKKPVVVETPASNTTEVVSPKREKIPNNPIESQLEVYVSAVASPSRFWIQIFGKQSAELDKLIESMTEYYDKLENQKLHKIANPYLGQIVAAVYKYDSKWYRAEIVGFVHNDYNPRNVVLDLYFVDFGDSEYVQPNDVFELRTDFLTLRFQAIECFLANVKPTNKDDSEIWEPQAVSLFEDLTHVARWKKMNARIITTKERKYGDPVKREGSPIPGVQLFNTETPDINIADELVAAGLAETITSNGNSRSESLLRLDSGDESSETKSSRNSMEIGKIHSVESQNGEFAASSGMDNSLLINGNNVVKMSNAKNSSKDFIDIEKQNGNKVINESDTIATLHDSTLNRSYKVS